MRISAVTRVCCLIGDPVEHSLSPAMHNAAFKALGLDLVYLAFRVRGQELRRAVEGIRSLGIVGANVTIPHKVAVVRLVDSLSPAAEAIGAVNTILNDGGRLIGYNTDAEGAIAALEGRIDPRGKSAVVLGAGGAARAIAFCLARRCERVTILNRTGKRAVELARSLSGLRASLSGMPLTRRRLREALHDADILINATPVGMAPDVDGTLVPSDLLRPDLVVFDIVYNPPRTRLLREAEAVGAVTVSGLEMLVRQGAMAFSIWTGREAPLDVMRRAALAELGGHG